jgi:hypothetical protein
MLYLKQNPIVIEWIGATLNMAITEAYLANTYFKLGELDKSDYHKQNIINRLQSGDKNLDISLAMIAAARGEKEETFNWLEKAYNNKAMLFMYYIQMDPIFNFIRSDERFIDLTNRPGFEI